MHFLDPEGLKMAGPAEGAANGNSSSARNLVYINLLRDPGALRASSFYFARDCICMQRPAYNYTIRNSSWYEIQDEWCKAEWSRKSDALCATDVNACYADLDSCRRTFPADAVRAPACQPRPPTRTAPPPIPPSAPHPTLSHSPTPPSTPRPPTQWPIHPTAHPPIPHPPALSRAGRHHRA
jgi:hypothetical protein